MNAVEAMSRADRRMKILQIETATDSTRAALIKIADSGPGFDSKMAEQLFKPFFTTKVGGMGMGLPICRSIIDAHGGKLTFSSRQPQGALFLIVLPPT